MIVDKLLQEELKMQAREINGSERLYLELYQVVDILENYKQQQQVSVEPEVEVNLAEWISVGNMMPNLGEKVLVALDNGWVILIGRLMTNGWTAFYSDGEELVNKDGNGSDVTHWMPLPEPPKQ